MAILANVTVKAVNGGFQQTYKVNPVTLVSSLGTGGGTPLGPNSSIQFNDSTVFGGNAAFTFNKNTLTVTVGNSTVNVAVNSSVVSVGSNVKIESARLFVGNSTVNAVINSTAIDIDGTITAGNGSFQDMSVSGNLTVSGTLTTINTTNLTIQDPLIKLANNNSADLVDLGFYGVYTNGGTKYAAFFRDQSDSGKYKLYTGLTNEPGTTVDLTGGALGALVVGALEATSLTLTNPLAVGSGGTGAGTFTSKGVLYGNATGALQVTAAGTFGQILQANSTGFPVWGDLDGGTF